MTAATRPSTLPTSLPEVLPAGSVERLLVAGRWVVGGGTLIAPRSMGRVFGIDAGENPALPYVGRLFGVRAVAMALQLAGSSGAERRRHLQFGMTVDLVDLVAALAAGRSGSLQPRAAAAAALAAAVEASLGGYLLART